MYLKIHIKVSLLSNIINKHIRHQDSTLTIESIFQF